MRYIELKPSFKELVELHNMLEQAQSNVASLIEGQDTPQRASDLYQIIKQIETKTKEIVFVDVR